VNSKFKIALAVAAGAALGAALDPRPFLDVASLVRATTVANGTSRLFEAMDPRVEASRSAGASTYPVITSTPPRHGPDWASAWFEPTVTPVPFIATVTGMAANATPRAASATSFFILRPPCGATPYSVIAVRRVWNGAEDS